MPTEPIVNRDHEPPAQPPPFFRRVWIDGDLASGGGVCVSVEEARDDRVFLAISVGPGGLLAMMDREQRAELRAALDDVDRVLAGRPS
jgi:hypothetical protein